MPTYDFKCDKCQKNYERITKYSIKELPCEECSNPTFKIDKFYVTDFVTRGDGFHASGSASLKTGKGKRLDHEEYFGTMSPDWDSSKIHGIDK